MKKFLAIALIAASFAACNNSSDKKKDNKDSVVVTPPAKDSTNTPKDSTATVPVKDSVPK
jgi:predicted component of type VI protein secretion system